MSRYENMEPSTLKVPITTAADAKFCDIFTFVENKGSLSNFLFSAKLNTNYSRHQNLVIFKKNLILTVSVGVTSKLQEIKCFKF